MVRPYAVTRNSPGTLRSNRRAADFDERTSTLSVRIRRRLASASSPVTSLVPIPRRCQRSSTSTPRSAQPFSVTTSEASPTRSPAFSLRHSARFWVGDHRVQIGLGQAGDRRVQTAEAGLGRTAAPHFFDSVAVPRKGPSDANRRYVHLRCTEVTEAAASNVASKPWTSVLPHVSGKMTGTSTPERR
jgi:hypothetical protein